MKKYLLAFKRGSQGGQGIMEYIILSSFIGIFCLVALKQFGTVLEKRIDYLKSQLVEHMKLQ